MSFHTIALLFDELQAQGPDSSDLTSNLSALFDLLDASPDFPDDHDLPHALISFFCALLPHPLFSDAALRLIPVTIHRCPHVIPTFAACGAAPLLAGVLQSESPATRSLALDAVLAVAGRPCDLALDLLPLALDAPPPAALAVVRAFVGAQAGEAVGAALDRVIEFCVAAWRDRGGCTGDALHALAALCERGFAAAVVAAVPLPALTCPLHNPARLGDAPAVARLAAQFVVFDSACAAAVPIDPFIRALERITAWQPEHDDILLLLAALGGSGQLLHALSPWAQGVFMRLLFDFEWRVRELVHTVLWRTFLVLNLDEQVAMANLPVFVPMTADICLVDIVPEVIAAFRAIGEADCGIELSTRATDAIIELLEMCVDSDFADDADEVISLFQLE
jgi:hypothetical protein